ncbi:MAG: DUF1592 domain-containing protein [Pirellulaceae bacterium]|nr:DUF1592 domain-containing protein [Pirellulaceae bacterium]
MLGVLSAATASAQQVGAPEFERSFAPEIQPLLKKYCFSCHAGDTTEADIDLAAYADVASARRDLKSWQKARRMLVSRQMPPKESKQLNDKERQRLTGWVKDFLTREAAALAGDPGRVVLRRMNNDEYTYAIRDLTGVAALSPAAEFPVDGAAGEGFTNTGDALAMSPSLVRKYLDAGKQVAKHMALTPTGIRFSEHTTRHDKTNDALDRIRRMYDASTDKQGGTAVNLQGIKFETNQGGRLDILKYLTATLAERDALASGAKKLDDVARERNLNPKYLGILWATLNSEGNERSFLLDQFRERWRAAQVDDAAALAKFVGQWQSALWKFNSIGHIGREGGAQAWMEPVSPLAARQQLSVKIPADRKDVEIPLHLVATDAGDGNAADVVVWRNPQLVIPGSGAVPLSKLASGYARLQEVRRERLSKVAKYLAAASARGDENVTQLAARHGVDEAGLRGWLEYLAISKPGVPVAVTGHYTKQMRKGGNYDFIQGWGTTGTPSVSANSSDQQVRIPGIARPHSVFVHPSPTLFTAIGWRSPTSGVVRIDARLSDAHPECGNGVEWFLQHRTSNAVSNLWKGDFEIAGSAKMETKTMAVRQGELLSFLVGPRDKTHACDLTAIDLTITEVAGEKRTWDLAKEVSGNILNGNPHADLFGNVDTWHFYKGAMSDVNKQAAATRTIPPQSLLAKWIDEKDAARRGELARRVQQLAIGPRPKQQNTPDLFLYDQLQELASPPIQTLLKNAQPDGRFGKHPRGSKIAANDLVVLAPSRQTIMLPGSLAAGGDVVVTGELDGEHGREGSVQLALTINEPTAPALSERSPLLAHDGSAARARAEKALDQFRNLFPPALCYARVVPVDEVVTLTLFHREDEHLQRLMLNEQQTARLNQLWDELYYISREPLRLVVAFEQISEFATQDRPDLVKAFKVLDKPIRDRAAAFQKRLIETEPAHVEAVLEFADRAWRRRLSSTDEQSLRSFYGAMRSGGIEHDQAIRLLLARVLASPAYLYRLERPRGEEKSSPVSGHELASRLSFFLWSSVPDEPLRRAADAGQLLDEKTLLAHTHRLLDGERTRRLAVQFACQWLHVRDFDQNDEKNEKLYPEFAGLRDDMYEEVIRFFVDMFQNDRSILSILDSDHTFLNEPLAKHYGIGGVTGSEWRRVGGVRAHRRGGILAMAATLSKQSGASRTSPILRGNWVYETLLGERLPRPPANVPQLPELVPRGQTARQLIEEHSANPGCVNCHSKIDSYGFSLEQYDTIGRVREKEVDTEAVLEDGTKIKGVDGLRDYLLNERRDEVIGQFCRKLLGYALGREIQLSDEPLLAEMQQRLRKNDYRFHVLIETIVTSRQFRQIRGKAE